MVSDEGRYDMEPDMMIIPPDDGQYEKINPGKAMVDEGLNERWNYKPPSLLPLLNVDENWPAPLKSGPAKPKYRQVAITIRLDVNMTALAHDDEYLPSGEVDLQKVFGRIYTRVYELLEQENIPGLRGRLVNIT